MRKSVLHFLLFGLVCFLAPNAMAQVPGNALDFDGTTDFISYGTIDETHPLALVNTDFTISLWIKPELEGDTYQRIVSKESAGNGAGGFSLRLDPSSQALSFAADGEATITAVLQDVEAKEWMHIAVSYDLANTTYKLYANGQLLTQAIHANSPSSASAKLRIGNSHGVADREFQGQIDELSFWNTARDANSIVQDMHKELTGAETGLLAYYQFNETEGDNLSDLGANGLDATLYGFVHTGLTWTASEAMCVVGTVVLDEKTFLVSMSYDPVIGATNYRADISESSDFSTFIVNGENVSLGNTTETTVSNITLDPSKTYYLRVRAEIKTWTSPNSAVSTLKHHYKIVSISDLNLNRTATELTEAAIAGRNFDPAYTGFIWNSEDQETHDWRPQGVSTYTTEDADKWVLTSWYGRYDSYEDPIFHTVTVFTDYRDRGARISFVNITDMSNIKYRHVLLVDEDYKPFYNLHAGGITVANDSVYVADSRSLGQMIISFDLTKIQEVDDASDFKNYGYILKMTRTDTVSVKASFISYDHDDDKFLVGRFSGCNDPFESNETTFNGNPYCTDNSTNQIGWYDLMTSDANSPYFSGFSGSMQGAASMTDPRNPSRKLIWTTASVDRNHNSMLYAFSQYLPENNAAGQELNFGSDFKAWTVNSGIEDLDIDESGENIWTLTEFPSNEPLLGNNKRIVVAFRVSDVMPPEHNYSQDSITDATHCEKDQIELTASSNFVTYADMSYTNTNWINCDSVVPSLVNSNRSFFTWMRKSAKVSTTNVIFGTNDAGEGNICNLQVSDSEELSIYDGTTTRSTGVEVTTDKWYHVGYTYDATSGETKVYINGNDTLIYVNSSQTITDLTDRISIGQEFDGTTKGNWFTGKLTEVSFWNEVLSPTDIALLMESTIKESHPKYANLKAYYPMIVEANADNKIIVDYSGNGFNATTPDFDVQTGKDVEQIPGFNSTDHFAIEWKNGETVLGTDQNFDFLFSDLGEGNYSVDYSIGEFLINDDFILSYDVTETTPPTPDVVTLEDIISSDAITELTAPTATDACTQTVNVTHNASLPITAIGTTEVTWTYEDGNGNTTTQTQNVVIQTTAGINNSSEDLELSVYPNPTNGAVNIEFSEIQNQISVEVISLTGQVIESISYKSQQSISFNFEADPGIYLIQLVTEKVSSVTRIINQ